MTAGGGARGDVTATPLRRRGGAGLGAVAVVSSAASVIRNARSELEPQPASIRRRKRARGVGQASVSSILAQPLSKSHQRECPREQGQRRIAIDNPPSDDVASAAALVKRRCAAAICPARLRSTDPRGARARCGSDRQADRRDDLSVGLERSDLRGLSSIRGKIGGQLVCGSARSGSVGERATSPMSRRSGQERASPLGSPRDPFRRYRG